jgi:hypothetical protein
LGPPPLPPNTTLVSITSLCVNSTLRWCEVLVHIHTPLCMIHAHDPCPCWCGAYVPCAGSGGRPGRSAAPARRSVAPARRSGPAGRQRRGAASVEPGHPPPLPPLLLPPPRPPPALTRRQRQRRRAATLMRPTASVLGLLRVCVRADLWLFSVRAVGVVCGVAPYIGFFFLRLCTPLCVRMCVCGTWYPVVAGEDSDDDIGPQPQNLSGFTKGQSTGSVSTRLPVCVCMGFGWGGMCVCMCVHGVWLGWNVCVCACVCMGFGWGGMCVCMCVHWFWLGWSVCVSGAHF